MTKVSLAVLTTNFLDTMGTIPAEFLQSAFLTLKPIANLIEKPINLMENIHRDEFVDDYIHMETWLNDNPGARRGLSRVCEIHLPRKPAGRIGWV